MREPNPITRIPAGPPAALGLCVALLLSLVIEPVFPSTRNPDDRNTLDFGVQRLILNGKCFFGGGNVEGGDFFSGLRRKESPDGFRFYKRGRLVSEYPDQLSITLRVSKFRCTAQGAPRDLELLVLSDDFLSSLKFKVEWKVGTRLRPVDGFVLLGYKHLRENLSFSSDSSQDDVVQYQMTLTSKGIPLSDHLIVSVFNSDDTLFVRLSAAP